jgi:hypothetical protein
MSLDGERWKAKYRDVQVALRQCGARDFQIAVGDGVLTHFHPARDCDLNTAMLRANNHAVQFARLRPHRGDGPADQVVTLEWESIGSAETKGAEGSDVPCRQGANATTGPDPSV